MSDISPIVPQNGYIQLPVTVDPNALVAAALAAISALLPGWVPQEGNIETLLLEQFAQMDAETAQVAAQVPLAIFQYFGSLVGIDPIDGVSAQALTTWTMIDNAGYTVPAGTVVAYLALGNVQIQFATVGSFTVSPGSTTATGVVIEALVTGTVNNGIADTTPIVPVNQLAFVASIVATTATAGGIDTETLHTYLNRLSGELRLLAPRPILPQDFAALAPQVAGAYRATAINGLSPGRTITGTITLVGSNVLNDTAGSFTALDVGRSVTGTDIPSSTTISTFTDAHHVTMNHSATGSLTGGSVVLGDLTNQERTVTVAAVDINGNALTGGVPAELSAYLEAKREVNFIVNVIGPTYSPIDVSFVGVSFPGQDPVAIQDAAIAALVSFLSKANWGTQTTVINGTTADGTDQITNVVLPSGSPATGIAIGQPISGLGIPVGTTITDVEGTTLTISNSATASGTVILTVSLDGTWDSSATVVRYLELVAVAGSVPGMQYISSLTFAIHGNSLATSDINLPGDAPMTSSASPAVITGSVTSGT